MALSTLRRLLHLLRVAWRVRRLRRAHAADDRRLAQAALGELLAGGRGLGMKLGQIYADRSAAQALQPLLDGIEPLALERVLPLIEQQLGAAPESVFSELDPACCAASLGQVHHARLRDGREVAVKVRYPDIEQAVEDELRLTGLLPGVGPARRWGFDLDGYRRTLRENFRRELDYRDEAARQARLADALDVPGLVVPEVIGEHCRAGLLVQSWEGGEALRNARDWPLGERLAIARSLLLALFQSLFRIGELHGDPHAGNLQVRRTPQGVETLLFDYGCTLPLAAERRLALLRLILSARGEAAPINPLQGYVGLGFDALKLAHVAPELAMLNRRLLRPFLLDEPFDTRRWGLGEAFEQALGVRRWWFRSAGPADVLLLMRVFQGMVNHLEMLDVRLPWWPLLVQAAGEETLNAARELVLPPLPSGVDAAAVKPIAARLRVVAHEGEREIADMTLPPEAALELDALIPDALRERIETATPGRLQGAMRTARESSLAPQTLFDTTHDGRHYRVWLE